MPLEAGVSAPLLTTTLPDQDGAEHTISDKLTEGPVLLAIYKSSCPACKTMMPFLNRLQERYADKGLTVYGVAQDSANVTRSFIRRSGIEYPILIEGDDYPLSKAFDVFGTPAVYVIDQQGQITYTTQGFMRDQVDEIGAAAAQLVGEAPAPVITEAETEEVPRFIPGCPGKHLD
ncbi:MAG: TlpA family protein disulfide reductase [Thermomicrobiales bacterium]|nr:TlpA family protein disulfide reductase [Thermomicrobiales bacterium]